MPEIGWGSAGCPMCRIGAPLALIQPAGSERLTGPGGLLSKRRVALSGCPTVPDLPSSQTSAVY
jgi:hypothetical protein